MGQHRGQGWSAHPRRRPRLSDLEVLGVRWRGHKDVGDHRIAVGNPALDRGETSKIKLKDGSGRSAYPWKYHFNRGYPEEAVKMWLSEISNQ